MFLIFFIYILYIFYYILNYNDIYHQVIHIFTIMNIKNNLKKTSTLTRNIYNIYYVLNT